MIAGRRVYIGCVTVNRSGLAEQTAPRHFNKHLQQTGSWLAGLRLVGLSNFPHGPMMTQLGAGLAFGNIQDPGPWQSDSCLPFYGGSAISGGECIETGKGHSTFRALCTPNTRPDRRADIVFSCRLDVIGKVSYIINHPPLLFWALALLSIIRGNFKAPVAYGSRYRQRSELRRKWWHIEKKKNLIE